TVSKFSSPLPAASATVSAPPEPMMKADMKPPKIVQEFIVLRCQRVLQSKPVSQEIVVSHVAGRRAVRLIGGVYPAALKHDLQISKGIMPVKISDGIRPGQSVRSHPVIVGDVRRFGNIREGINSAKHMVRGPGVRPYRVEPFNEV